MQPEKQKKVFKTEEGIEVVAGMNVFVYPHNRRHGGTIKQRKVASVDGAVRLEGGGYYSQTGYYDRDVKLYFTQEAALEARKAHKAEPLWRKYGKFSISTTATLEKYLIAESGLPADQIDVSLTGGRWNQRLHICWGDKNGLHKEQVPWGRRLTEETFAPMIAKMKER